MTCVRQWGFVHSLIPPPADCGTVGLDDIIFCRTNFPPHEFSAHRASAGRDGDFMKDCRTVRGFPQIYSAAVDCGAVELNVLIFRRTSFPPGDSGVVVYSYSPANINSA